MDLRSKNVTQGVERAPNRSLFYAMGYTKEELERPLIGVVSAHSEIVPGHFHLDKLTEAVKAGVRMAGMVPFPGSAIPSDSQRQFILFAVYIPEHEPQPGHVLFSNSQSFSSSIMPALHAPTASNILDRLTSSPP